MPLVGGGGKDVASDAHDGPFSFLADPLLGTVTVENSLSPQSRPATPRSNSRVLLPDTELSRVQFTYEFQTGNRLVIRAAYRNVTEGALFLHPFFQRSRLRVLCPGPLRCLCPVGDRRFCQPIA